VEKVQGNKGIIIILCGRLYTQAGTHVLVECATRMWHSISGSGYVWARGCVREGSCDYARSDCDGGSDCVIEYCCSDGSHDCNGHYTDELNFLTRGLVLAQEEQ
jgi:hypothetical protein